MLREAGVVDAGGAGIVEIVRGLALGLAGEPLPEAPEEASRWGSRRSTRSSRGTGTAPGSSSRATGSTSTRLERSLERLGDSLLVVGDPSAVKVHVHTDDPGAAISLGDRAGRDRPRRDRGHARADLRA